jgi:hypothetical protein
MLTAMYSALRPIFQGRSIWVLTDYIGIRLGIAHDVSTPWFPIPLLDYFESIWSLEDYVKEGADPLGDLLVQQQIRIANKDFTPLNTVELEKSIIKVKPVLSDVVYQLEPFGTGRLGKALHNEGALAFIGIEPSLLLYRIGLINITCFDLPVKLYYKHTDREPGIWSPMLRKKFQLEEVD